jgi:hypothetical protein
VSERVFTGPISTLIALDTITRVCDHLSLRVKPVSIRFAHEPVFVFYKKMKKLKTFAEFYAKMGEK